MGLWIGFWDLRIRVSEHEVPKNVDPYENGIRLYGCFGAVVLNSYQNRIQALGFVVDGV